MSTDGGEVVWLDFFFFLTKFLIDFTDVLDEFDDGLEVEVVDAVLDLVVVFEGVVVSEEGFE